MTRGAGRVEVGGLTRSLLVAIEVVVVLRAAVSVLVGVAAVLVLVVEDA